MSESQTRVSLLRHNCFDCIFGTMFWGESFTIAMEGQMSSHDAVLKLGCKGSIACTRLTMWQIPAY